jgi:hypothetical protein
MHFLLTALTVASPSDIGGDGGTIYFPGGAISANLNNSPVVLAGTSKYSGFGNSICSFTIAVNRDLGTKIVGVYTGRMSRGGREMCTLFGILKNSVSGIPTKC